MALVADVTSLFPAVEESSTLTLAVEPDQYSASVIARAVEDCDAHVLNLNVGAERTAHGELTVYLRVNHRNGAAVARSLERFGYRVTDVSETDDGDVADSARDRVNELLRYLEI